MITSMTGFGSAEKISEKYSLNVEIKTVNSKFFDASFRLPRAFLKWEMEIKALLEKELGRGKINLGVHFELKNLSNHRFRSIRNCSMPIISVLSNCLEIWEHQEKWLYSRWP